MLEHPADHQRVKHIAADDQVAQLAQHRQQRVGVLMEQACRHPQHAHGLFLQQLGKCGLGQQHRMLDHHHTTAIEQRRPHIQGTGIERRVGGEGHAVALVKVGIVVVEHQPRDGAVRHLHAFGRASGAGGVHDVRHLVRRLRKLQVARRQAIQVQVGQGMEYMPRSAVLHHKGLAFERRVDVQRHIHRCALEDRQLAHQQIQRAWQRNRHALTRLHALVDQVMGQAVGTAVEVTIAQGQRTLHRRHGFGPRQCLSFEQLVHSELRRVLARGGVELDQQLVTLGRRQNRHRLQRGGRRLLQRGHQVAERGEHVVAHALHIQTGHALYGQRKAGAEVIDVEHQRVVAALLGTENLDTVGGKRAVSRCLVRGAVTEVEQGTEQRQRTRYTTATLGQGQRSVLVPKQLRQARMGGAHAGLHAGGAQADAQRQGVDEHAQRPVGALAALHAPQQYGTKHHILLAGDLGQHLRPGQVHQARAADTQLSRLFAQALAERRGQRQMRLDDAAAVAVDILQTERQRGLVNITQHVAEKGFVLRLGHAQTRLGHVIAVLHRRRQLRAVAGQAGAHLLHQHLQGGVVEQDMVQQQDACKAILLLRITEMHQRRAAQVEAEMAWVKALLQLRQRIISRHVEALDVQRRLAQHHLHRLIQAFPQNAGAQDVVTLDHTVQGAGKRVHRHLVGKIELHLQHVGVALGRCQVVIQDAGLQRRQAVDILHVGDAAGHVLEDVVDGRLVQRHQRQHVGADVCAARRDHIRRHLHFLLPAHRRGECAQGGLAEQHAHVAAQLHLAHAFDQLDRQQRVAAQLEEVVVAPDVVEFQQRLPDAGDGAFHSALRGGVVSPRQGVGIRRGQGFAVELAVGGQRELVQQHEGAGHHVFGQAQQQMVAQFSGTEFALGDHVGHQAFVTGLVFTGDNHRVTHAVGAGQSGFDFAQFNAEAADLHLVIVTAQVFDAAIGQQAAEVTGLVHAQAGGRVGQEAFGIQLVTVEVTARHTGAADIQLADHTHR